MILCFFSLPKLPFSSSEWEELRPFPWRRRLLSHSLPQRPSGHLPFTFHFAPVKCLARHSDASLWQSSAQIRSEQLNRKSCSQERNDFTLFTFKAGSCVGQQGAASNWWLLSPFALVFKTILTWPFPLLTYPLVFASSFREWTIYYKMLPASLRTWFELLPQSSNFIYQRHALHPTS